MRYSLKSMLTFAGLLALYVGFHAWLNGAFNGSTRPYPRYGEPNYWYQVPKDIASLLACCFLVPFVRRGNAAAIVGVAACALSVCLSCVGLFCYRWSQTWFRYRPLQNAWSTLDSVSWILVVIALCLAVYVSPQRDSTPSS